MSSLLEMQREMAKLVMQPMTKREGIPVRSRAAAEKIVKPNDRLTSLERVEIYQRSYWFRLIDCFAEDFPGVRAIMGAKRFRRMSEAYLADCPSRSFTLRNLGSRLLEWLHANPKWLGRESQLIQDMVALEWAQIEAFDGLQRPPITPEELAQSGAELRLELQPYISLLRLQYPVDNLLLAVRDKKRTGPPVAAMLNAPTADIFVAVHRLDYSVHFKRLEPEAFAMLSLVRNGVSLVKAIEDGFANSDLSEEQQAQNVEQWFRQWQSMGWFCSRLEGATDSAKEIDERLE